MLCTPLSIDAGLLPLPCTQPQQFLQVLIICGGSAAAERLYGSTVVVGFVGWRHISHFLKAAEVSAAVSSQPLLTVHVKACVVARRLGSVEQSTSHSAILGRQGVNSLFLVASPCLDQCAEAKVHVPNQLNPPASKYPSAVVPIYGWPDV